MSTAAPGRDGGRHGRVVYIRSVTNRYPWRSPDVLLWLYVLAAPLVGPAIIVGALSLTRGGGDSCDSIYRGDWASRDTEFDAAQTVQVVGAGAMIAVGCVLVGVLMVRRRRVSRLRFFSALVATAAVLLGYLFIIVVSGYSTDCF